MTHTLTRLFLTLSLSGLTASSALAAPRPVKITDGLKRPTFLTAPAGSTDYLYILEQPGRVRLYDRKKKQLIQEPLLDLTSQVRSKSSEQGLLGMAFSPNFDKDSRFYLNYTNKAGDTVISRFTIPRQGEISEEKLIQFTQDYANHNGGWIGFGPDGMLYIGTGDGGSANDPKGRAQDVNAWLGKMLRIDVSPAKGYSIPKGNYAEATKTKARPEILSIGLRNPWRCCWDGDMFYIADVGQNAHEEINVVDRKDLAGANFGWRLREGNHPTPKKQIAGERPENNIEPVHEYNRRNGLSITGGFVYRGKIKSLQGQYFFADYAYSNIWSLSYKNKRVSEPKKWNNQFKVDGKYIRHISSFGLDPQGEIYLVSHLGSIYKLIE